MREPAERLQLDQDQPPRPIASDEVRSLPEAERHARLLSALRALLELPPTREREPEG